MSERDIQIPKTTKIIRDGDPDESRGEHAQLSKDTIAGLNDLLAKHPNLAAGFTLVWTPGSHEQTHLAIAAEGVSLAQMKRFTEMAVGVFLGLLDQLENDPKSLTGSE